jgi:hypothetical protein
MTEEKFYSPLKIGLFIVVLSYFLFTLHATFTLSWIGEWNHNGHFSFYVFATDISAGVGLGFRFAASIIAICAAIFYLNKGTLTTAKTYKLLRWVLVLEAIYWFGLITTAVLNVQNSLQLGAQASANLLIDSWLLTTIPSVVEATLIPATLLILAYKLSPAKPLNGVIKWALITGTSYIFVFWLTNTSMWFITLRLQTGYGYLTTYPQNLVSFILTTFGLLALTIYSAYFTKKSSGAKSFQELNLKIVGGIILALGMYFLWNYLTWIFFGGNHVWSLWYAWFLGHNLDLWMLSLPLLGIPLLFADQIHEKTNPP